MPPRPAASTAAASVSVREVSMVYGTTAAVDRASFELPRGRFLTILGPSGSGKTTLLRMIAGFVAPTAGEIVINGEAVAAVPPYRRAIGMVFQKLALFPHMTAAENVAFPLRMRRHDARRIPDQVARFLALVRLEGFGGRRIHELSGGQQQRVAIARALVFEPDLLLLDEPLAALDRKLRQEMQLEFRRIQKELGVTTINVTHDQREALVVSDEIIVMNEGRILQHAHPVETYRAPRHPFVAGFIGVTNVLEGVARADGGQLALHAHGAVLPGVAAAGQPASEGAPARGMLRAEQIRLAAAREGLTSGTVLAGVVADAIFEGERTVYEIAVPALAGSVLRAFDHDPVAHAAFAPGDAVFLGWDDRDLQIFG